MKKSVFNLAYRTFHQNATIILDIRPYLLKKILKKQISPDSVPLDSDQLVVVFVTVQTCLPN